MPPALPPTEHLARQAALLELSTLSAPSHLPLGLWLLPSPSNPLLLNCTLFIHRGYFASSILTFSIALPPTYPHAIPTVTFATPRPFHPLVDPNTGRMNLDPRWTSWEQGRDYLWMLLHWIKGAFKRRALDEVRKVDVVNAEAFRLYRGDAGMFARLAGQGAELSGSEAVLYGKGRDSGQGKAGEGGIVFRKLDRAEEEEELARMHDALEGEVRSRLVKRKPEAAA